MTTAAVVGVGDELLAGIVVNTNAALIGQRLQGIGVPVVWGVQVGDVEDQIVATFRDAMSHARVVIITGGLGPTQDDRTRDALARLMGTELIRDEDALAALRQRFATLGREMPEANLKQTDHPAGTTLIPNPVGTAPGIRAELDGVVLYAIPGVPREAERMLDDAIVPELVARFEGAASIRSRELKCTGIAEAELAGRLADLATADEPRMAFLPGGAEVRLRFVATGASPDECEAELDVAEKVVRERLGSAIYGTGSDTLESVVGDLLKSKRLTLAVAESCTAGLLGSRIAAVPGSSEWFRGGLIAYQDDVKAKGLGIAPGLLQAAGPVSGEVALEMSRGARVAFEADVGVAITCSAGPQAQGASVGTTFISISSPSGAPVVREIRLPGDRTQVRNFAATFALNLLRLHLLGEPLR